MAITRGIYDTKVLSQQPNVWDYVRKKANKQNQGRT